MSDRSELAERIAAKIRDLKLTQPYGGDVTQDQNTKGKPYRIGFSVSLHLDGEVTVYGPTFIQVNFHSSSQGDQNAVLGSEAIAIEMLGAIAASDWGKVNSLPRKPPAAPKSEAKPEATTPPSNKPRSTRRNKL